MGASNRRLFFKLFVAEAVRGARQVAPILPRPVAVAAQQLPERAPSERNVMATSAAEAARRLVSRPELEELVGHVGLLARWDAIQACVRTGLRLSLADERSSCRSYLAAGVEPDPGLAVRRWDGHPLQTLAHIELAEVPHAAAVDLGLPRTGQIVLLWALAGAADGLSTEDHGSVAVFHTDASCGRAGRQRRRTTLRGTRPIRLSAELSLPRAWTQQVAAFGLAPAEEEAWQQLRCELAVRQGVLPFDECDSDDKVISMHRLLGYPDERLGQMPAACEAAARGIDLAHRPPYEHPRLSELEAASDHWQLLFQLSADETLGWDWGGRRERLYVWIRKRDLRRGDFGRVWAITQ